MKKRVGLFLISSLLIVVLISSPVIAEGEYLFQRNDPQGDEYGPGTYVYPTSQQFSPFEGLFDLLAFSVKEYNSNYLFELKFGTITNPWHAKYGFSHQLVQIYIDNDTDGSTKVFKKGANVKFSSEAPWNKLIKINGWNVKVFDYQDNPGKEKKVSGVSAQVLDDEQTIQVKVPKKLIGNLSSAQYYVLVGSLDGFSYDNYRPVIEEVSEWKFGGGTDSDFNPNVLDILVPTGKDQKQILGDYNVEKEKFATLYPVESNSKLPSKLLFVLGILVLFTLVLGIIKCGKRLINIDQ